MNKIILGDVEIIRVEETHGPVGLTAQQFIPEMPERVWKEHETVLVPDHLSIDDGLVQVAFQTWLLRSAGRTILVDTGIGNDKPRPLVPTWDHRDSGTYLQNLARAGVAPADVDLVVNTHLHVDHIGWNTRLDDGAWVPTFPNATYLMPETDFRFWNPATNPEVAGGVNDNGYEDSVAPVHRSGQVRLWEGSHRIDENLVLESAPGHTPGSSVITLQAGTDAALFAGDLLHSPVQVFEPDHNSCFCQDPVVARASRHRLLGWAAEHRALVLPAHFSGSGALEVGRDGGRFSIRSWAPFDRL